MKFTKKQFDEIGPWHFNDLCFDSTNQTTMLKIFNLLPSYLQGSAISYGCNDTVFRDDVFEYLIENQFDMSVKEYYNSDIFNFFMKKDVYQKISFKKLKSNQIEADYTPIVDGKLEIWDIKPSYNPDKGRYDEKIKNLINKHNKDA